VARITLAVTNGNRGEGRGLTGGGGVGAGEPAQVVCVWSERSEKGKEGWKGGGGGQVRGPQQGGQLPGRPDPRSPRVAGGVGEPQGAALWGGRISGAILLAQHLGSEVGRRVLLRASG